jgi:autoinducer-2 kinase
LDTGTGSVRAVLFDTTGAVVAQAGREWTHRSLPEFPGSMEFEGDKNWELAVTCIRDVVHQVNPKDIASASSTSMREGIVTYDKSGNELWACANVDARAVEQERRLRAKREGFERWMYSQSGQTFALGAPPRLQWRKDSKPRIYEQIPAVCC